MATINPSRAFAKKRFERFAGLGASQSLSGEGAYDMCNLRIMPDGSLASREGFRTLAKLAGGAIRGFWEGPLDGTTRRFAVCGSAVYLLDVETDTQTVVATLSDTEGAVTFFLFEGQLYLLDGEELRVYQHSTKRFIPIEPYVPLVGNQWHPTSYGDIYEPLNLLTNRMRVRYLNSIASTVFYLPYYADKVEAVYVDGVRANDVTLKSGGEYIEVPSAETATRIDVVMSASFLNDASHPLQKSRRALTKLFGKAERLFLYGGEDESCVYCSKTVTTEMLNVCRVHIPSALPLYFRESDVLFLGSREHPAHALLPYRDEILAFGDRETWRIYSNDNVNIEAECISSDLECPSYGMALLCDGTPTLAGSRGLARMETLLSRPELLQIDRMLYPTANAPFEDFQTVISTFLPQMQEIWLRDAADPNGSVWVYRIDQKEWYRFDGICATLFFRSSLGLVFGTEDGKICLFDPNLTSDDGVPFRCFYQSTCFDFGTSETVRRALRASLSANLHGGEAMLTLTDEKRSTQHRLRGKHEHVLEHFDIRRRNGRYRFLCFSIDVQSSCRTELFKLSFFTNP